MTATQPWSLSLDGEWTLTGGPEQPGTPHPSHLASYRWKSISATVPGCSEIALVAAGIEPDPRVGDAVYRFRAYEGHEWWWQRTFTITSLPAGDIELVCEALEGLATIWLDGVEIGRTTNALISHRLAMPTLQPGVHHLAIRFASTVLAGRKQPLAASEFFAGALESLHLRVAGHQLGWDILPRLIGTGIPRNIRLELAPCARVRGAYWGTLALDLQKQTARIAVHWDLDLPTCEAGWRMRACLTRNGVETVIAAGEVFTHAGRAIVDLPNPAVWWPRGWGSPEMYQAKIELLDPSGTVVHGQYHQIGIRTVQLLRGKGDFAIAVNGRRLWARGTNWVPLDALHTRDAQHRDAALAMVADLDCNVLRMWGGNRYEDDAVYDWCDANGVLVWQDFTLACGVYPQTDEFAKQLSTEAEAVIRRLRNHPCIALWCGGNETDDCHDWAGYGVDPRRDRPTRETLPRAVRAHDPLRPYLANSPCHDEDPQPEIHLWGPRDDWLSPFYTECKAVFISEAGFHGSPSVASLTAMQPAGTPLWPLTDRRWQAQASCSNSDPNHPFFSRLALLVRQSGLLVGGPPDTLDDLVLASQLSQAEAKKALVERFRIAKGRTWGMLWWNLRDGWPLISDAVVDYFGRRKLAYAVLRRSHARILPVIAEAAHGRHRIMLVNDTLNPVTGRLVVRRSDQTTLLDIPVTIAADAVCEVAVLPASPFPDCWNCSLMIAGAEPALNHQLVGERPYRLTDLTRWYHELGLSADGVDLAAR